MMFLLVIAIVNQNAHAQFYKTDEPFAHTFSIVARDAKTGEMAVGVQSHWFSVGTLVSWGKSGVGVVATQSFVNPAYGPNGLKLMANGKSAEEALIILTADEDFNDTSFEKITPLKRRRHSYIVSELLSYGFKNLC